MKARTQVVVLSALLVLNGAAAAGALPPSPRDVLGVDVGTDRVLASYGESERYLRALAQASDRVRVVEMGPTVEGRTMIAAVVTSAANLARLDDLRAGWARIADPRGLDAAARERLLVTLPTCALITAGIHSTEVAGPQAALLLAYRLAAAPAGSQEAAWLDHTVVLIVPSLNPDGQEATVAWYRRWRGTPYEGSQPPFLYHRYAGHDNNRDFVYLTQPESRALNRFVYRDWHPQLFVDLHMMGATGPRQFVPPFADPIAPNVHPYVWRITSHLGTLMSLRLEESGKAGVVSGWTFDGNWIGGTRNTGWWKNVFGVLTETASAALAAPIEVDENELHGGGKGLVEYRPQVNFPNPWRGGRWGLADAVGYQLVIMNALVEFAATERQAVLRDASAMAAQAFERGLHEAPAAYLVPPEGDPGRRAHLVRLLLEAGVEGAVANGPIVADGVTYPAGTVVFAAAQPLRQYLIEVMERQHYPEVEPAPDAEILLPYDITAWTMPLELGVRAVRVEGAVTGDTAGIAPGWAPTPPAVRGGGAALVIPGGQLGGFVVANRALELGARVFRLATPSVAGGTALSAGSFVVEGLAAGTRDELLREAGADAVLVTARPETAVPLRRVRVGVYHPNFGLPDAGWLRFVLERARFDVEVVDSNAVSSGEFAKRVDVLVLPPLDGKTLVEGPSRHGPVAEPPAYRAGIGKDGVEALRRFFSGGGTILAFGVSAGWLAETLELPVTDVMKGVKREAFHDPGALLTVAIDHTSPLAAGMPARVAAMVEWGSAFRTRPVGGEETRTVAAHFPDEPLVVSGWVRGEELLRRRAAVVEVARGAGRAVLYSFAPYFRGQTEAAFPLLFNAVVERMGRPAGAPGDRS